MCIRDSRIGFTGTRWSDRKNDIIFFGFLHQLFLVGCAGPDRFAIRAKDQYFVGVFFLKMVNDFCIVASQDLLKIVLAHMPVPFEIRDDQGDFFPGIFNLLRCAAQFQLGAAGEDFQQGEFLFEDVEFTVVYTKKFNRVYGLQVNDSVCQLLRFMFRKAGKRAVPD